MDNINYLGSKNIRECFVIQEIMTTKIEEKKKFPSQS